MSLEMCEIITRGISAGGGVSHLVEMKFTSRDLASAGSAASADVQIQATGSDWQFDGSIRLKVSGSGWRRVLLAIAAVAFGLSVQAYALAQGGDEEEFDIPPSEMTDALQSHSEQAGVEITYAERDVANKTTNGVNSSCSKEAAIKEINEGTDLVYKINEDGVVVIRAALITTEEASAGEFASREIRVAQISGRSATDATVSDGDDEEDKRDVIVATGTNIRGIAPESSPTRTFDRQDILNSGVSTAQDFIQLLQFRRRSECRHCSRCAR